MTNDPGADLLLQAANIITGSRRETYGKAEDNFACIAAFWTTYLHRTGILSGGYHVEAHDVAAMMALLKIARIGEQSGHHDSWLDLAGYAGCGWRCAQHHATVGFPESRGTTHAELAAMHLEAEAEAMMPARYHA